MSASPAVEITALRKVYKQRIALDGVSLHVGRGEAVALLGPNGAGKTTLVNVLATVLAPTAGQVRVMGHDVVDNAQSARRSLGLVFQSPLLDGELRVDEVLRLQAMAHGLTGVMARRRVAEVLETVGLTDRARDRVAALSGGMRRRLELARGLLHEPEVLVLDEPTVGLDPQARATLWDHIRSLRSRGGPALLLATHDLTEADLCDRVAVLDNGRLIATDTPAALKRRLGGEEVILAVDDPNAALRKLRRMQDVQHVNVHIVGDEVVVRVTDASTSAPTIIRALGPSVRAVRLTQPSLHDAFSHLLADHRALTEGAVR